MTTERQHLQEMFNLAVRTKNHTRALKVLKLLVPVDTKSNRGT